MIAVASGRPASGRRSSSLAAAPVLAARRGKTVRYRDGEARAPVTGRFSPLVTRGSTAWRRYIPAFFAFSCRNWLPAG